MHSLLEIPTSTGDILFEILKFVLEILFTAYCVDWLIKRRESNRLKPIREDFIKSIFTSIDNERLVKDFSFLKFLTSSLPLEFISISQNPTEIDQAQKNIERKLPLKLTQKASDSIAQISNYLDYLKNKLVKIITQIDSSHPIFTIEINAVVSKIKQQLVLDIDSIESLKTFIEFPGPETFKNRQIECIYSIEFYLTKLNELSKIVSTDDLKIEWLERVGNFSDNQQKMILNNFYQTYPFNFGPR
jgi:hypothetical protein